MTPTFRLKIRIQNNRLVRAREELGMTQAVAARAMGVAASNLSAFENLNTTRNPAWSNTLARWTDTARKIADFYGYSPEYLWPEEIAALRKNAGQLEMSSREVCAFLDEERIEHRDFIAKVIPLMSHITAGDLTHHLDETTLQENAPKYGLTPGGMYQRMQNANQKFREAYRLGVRGTRLRGQSKARALVNLNEARRRSRAITVLVWKSSALPGCFGWPCLKAEHDGQTVRIWRGSPLTTNEQWLYALDDNEGRPGPITCVRGNRGTAKVAAGHALLRASKERAL